MKRPIFLLIFLLVIGSGIGQERYRLALINPEISASVGYISNIWQDSSGRLWLGILKRGLAYYDGTQIIRFPLEDEARFAAYPTVFTAGKEYLYLNDGRSVRVFDPLRRQIKQTIQVDTDSSSLIEIYLLNVSEQMGSTHLWAIGGMQETNEQQEELHLFHASAGRNLTRISTAPLTPMPQPVLLPTSNQTILLKSEQGLVEIDHNGKEIRKINLPGCDIRGINPFTCSMDEDGNLWFTFFNFDQPPYGLPRWPGSAGNTTPNPSPDYRYGLYCWQAAQDSVVFHSPLDPVVFSMKALGDQLLLTGNFPGVFRTYRPDTQTWGTLPIGHDAAFEQFRNTVAMFRDKSGVIWLGTNGLGQLIPHPDVFSRIPFEVPRGIAEDTRGRIYFGFGGSKNAEIARLDPSSAQLSHFKLTPGKEVYGLSLFGNDAFFWGDSKTVLDEPGLTLRHKSLDLDLSSRHQVVLNLLDRQGKLWVRSWDSDEIIILDPASEQVLKKTLTPPTLEANALYQRPSNGEVWLGSHREGILVFSEDGEFQQHYTTETSSRIVLKSNMTSAFLEDEAGHLWIGHGLGLSRIDATTDSIRHFELVTGDQYLNLVYGMLPDNDLRHLWIATNRGLYCFDTETSLATGFPFHPRIGRTWFTRVASYKAQNGRMYFGGSDPAGDFSGIIHFDPEELMRQYRQLEKARLPILIRNLIKYDGNSQGEVRLNPDPLTLSEIILKPGDRYFDLEFAVADYRYPQQNLYTHYLEGYDDDWSKPANGANRVRYENLPPGTYRLHLRGALFRENLVDNQRIIPVRIIAPWYRRPWATALFIFAAAALSFGVYRILLQRRLELAETKRIKELDDLKNRFFTNITHEFRTPLTVILGLIGNIRGYPEERDLIHRNGRNLLRMINELLDISKLDAGQLNVKLKQANIVPYLQYLSESFYSMAEENGIQLTFYTEQSEIVMDYDEDKIQHIVYNLLSNALKYTPEKGKVIVHVNQIDQGQSIFLQLKIKDTGIGIPADHLPHLFKRFHQISRSGDSNKAQSTGIGLAFTKELVTLLEGNIAVESTEGLGTTVELQLPVRHTATLEEAWFAHESAQRTISPEDLHLAGPNAPVLLIIEDNRDVAFYIRTILQTTYQVQTANNGLTGIERAIELIPDIIISDVMMPKKDGFEVCETLKADQRTSHIPIILLTAKASYQDRIEGLKFGADAYLTKPFHRQELLIRLEKLVEIRRTLQQRYANFPVTGSGPTQHKMEDAFLQQLHEHTQARLEDPEFNVPELAKSMAMSQMQVYRKLKALTGKTPSRFIRTLRLQRGRELLQSTDLTVSEIAYQVGFSDPNYFSRTFQQEFKRSPSDFRK